MAVGAVTILRTNDVAGNLKMVIANVVPTAGANYTVGGSAIPASAFGLNAVVSGTSQCTTQAATVGPGDSAVIPQPDGSILLKCNVAAGTGENGSNANLSACLVQVMVFGY